jgi:hypothetical protein
VGIRVGGIEDGMAIGNECGYMQLCGVGWACG